MGFKKPTMLLIESSDEQPDVYAMLQKIGITAATCNQLGFAEDNLQTYAGKHELVLGSDKLPNLLQYFNLIAEKNRFPNQNFAIISDDPSAVVPRLPWAELTAERLKSFIAEAKKPPSK